MYEQISHSLLNDILVELRQKSKPQNLQLFYTRLGANFYAIYSLFHTLYGDRSDFKEHMRNLVETLMRQYVNRSSQLKKIDLEREKEHNWFLSQKWVGMALYCDGYADNLEGMLPRLSYLQELGVNLVHIMPICDCPEGKSDGGYAVRDYRKIDSRFGTFKDFDKLAASMKKREMLLVLDVVVNHTSDQHEWAEKARQGDKTYQDYYFIFDDRSIPDIYEESMPEVFPETAPGNFTWDERMGKWVMTVFNQYQWDLNYRNPTVFIEMLDIILFWANQGADILRLDAVAFLWKKMGSACQNEREAHLILQLMKDCCQVTAPGVLFIAEAIVSPTEIIKYFGEDAINAKECEIAYNATFMALLWDAVATKKAILLNKGIQNIPQKLERATWLNYVRSHDDIGLGFSDADIVAAGYEPLSHRRFLVDYFTGNFEGSLAAGLAFGRNMETGDARISGSLASLAGLKRALETHDLNATNTAIKIILLLHGMILSFGGIPMLYYGDAIGTLNDDSYLNDESKNNDNRWTHRPKMNWEDAMQRTQPGTVQYSIFNGIKKMISVRKEIPAFADRNNREVLNVDNPHLFVFSRFDQFNSNSRVLVVGNFDDEVQFLKLPPLQQMGFFQYESIKDLLSGETLHVTDESLMFPARSIYWLQA
ncbi:amylosucrase [Nitrosomonas supralitoralis]|uniref:Alpha-amylase n=1 Tax=Nitrosomonas supralitoralis TaxID=2116706 RepID=A0A2P7NXY9_9PROT|nr:amylosucrase [Nitrosomonas supralitoralis]PSJ18307.1 alpha-amylase [Nitrosomonas supralitoralis]